MLHGNLLEGTFHVSETFRNQNLSETRGNAMETRFLKFSIWKLDGNLRFYFGNSRFCFGNKITPQQETRLLRKRQKIWYLCTQISVFYLDEVLLTRMVPIICRMLEVINLNHWMRSILGDLSSRISLLMNLSWKQSCLMELMKMKLKMMLLIFDLVLWILSSVYLLFEYWVFVILYDFDV